MFVFNLWYLFKFKFLSNFTNLRLFYKLLKKHYTFSNLNFLIINILDELKISFIAEISPRLRSGIPNKSNFKQYRIKNEQFLRKLVKRNIVAKNASPKPDRFQVTEPTRFGTKYRNSNYSGWRTCALPDPPIQVGGVPPPQHFKSASGLPVCLFL